MEERRIKDEGDRAKGRIKKRGEKEREGRERVEAQGHEGQSNRIRSARIDWSKSKGKEEGGTNGRDGDLLTEQAGGERKEARKKADKQGRRDKDTGSHTHARTHTRDGLTQRRWRDEREGCA